MASYFIKLNDLDEKEVFLGHHKTDADAMKQAEVTIQETVEYIIEKENQYTFQLWINESHGANLVKEKTITVKPAE